MPAKNIIKEYIEGGVYHIYNRGINKQDIFSDNKDYATLLYYLKLYLSNPKDLDNNDFRMKNRLSRKNFYDKIDLLCYCLMSNHFHLLIKQKDEKDMAEFMRCVATNYSMYFNDKYMRVGPLFQGRYKAILVKDDNYLLHLSRYIHMNPKELAKGLSLSKLCEYDYSSYANYLGKKDTKWVKPKFILDYFEDNKNQDIIDIIGKSSYQSFVEGTEYDSEIVLGNIVLE